MIVYLYVLPGDTEQIAIATTKDDVQVGDVIKTDADLPTDGQTKWRVTHLVGSRAAAVACS